MPTLKAVLHLCSPLLVIRAPPLLGIVFRLLPPRISFSQDLGVGGCGEGVGTGEALLQPVSEQDAQ